MTVAQKATELHAQAVALLIDIEGWQHTLADLRSMQLNAAMAGGRPYYAGAIANTKRRLADAEAAFDALIEQANALPAEAIAQACAARAAA